MPDETTHGWKVLDGDKGVWSYEYEFAANAKANCLAARIADGKVLILSPATGLSEASFAALEQLGEVAAVVATNGFHHLGQPAWRKRFPSARFFAPSEGMARIRKRNPDAGAFEPLSQLGPLLGDDVIVRELPNTKCGETYAIVKVDDGHIFFVSDILANIDRLPSNPIVRLMFKWTMSAPGYRVFNLGLAFIVRDKKAVLTKLLSDLENYPASVVVPAHGQSLTGEQIAAETKALVQAAL